MGKFNKIFKMAATKLNEFVEKVCDGMGRVPKKFLLSFWLGLLAKRNVLLSEIARGNNEDILLKKHIERLSNNLVSFDFESKALSNYHVHVKDYINDKTIFCIDNTDAVNQAARQSKVEFQKRHRETKWQ